MRSRTAVCLLAVAASAFLGASGPVSPPEPPPVVMFAAQTAANELAGAIVHERHISVAVAAGPAHFSQSNDAVLLMTDGEYRHVHFTHIVENGHVVNAAETAKREAASNRDLERGGGFFKQPFDRRYLGDYTYAIVPCLCPPGELDVHFTSDLRDDQHGEGDMVVDASTGLVVRVTYRPFVFPDRANAGSVTETFGSALPGLWTIVRIDRTYSGRVLLVTGHATVSEVLDHFHRFTDVGAGEAYYRDAMAQ